MTLPSDPILLLSVINTQLRDNYSDLDSLCEAYDVDRETITKKLAEVGYKYNKAQNQFK